MACRLNVIVSGGTGAGKTTLLNVLSSFISNVERIVTIEDAAELMLRQRHVVRLETRPPNIEGKGAVRQRDLVVNALRMRPDRIIVGEVRSDEALDMLQAMNTGHDGGLTTIHANSSRDALYRLDTMVAMANLNLPDRAVRQQIASALNLIIQVTRLSDGTRKVTAVTEVTGMEGDLVSLAGHLRLRAGRACGAMARCAAASARPASGRGAANGCSPSASACRCDMFEHVEARGVEEPAMIAAAVTFVLSWPSCSARTSSSCFCRSVAPRAGCGGRLRPETHRRPPRSSG